MKGWIRMKLVLEGLDEITTFLAEHYQGRDVNMALMDHDIMVNEDVLVLAEILTKLEEVEVVLANYEGISRIQGEADEDFLPAAIRVYGNSEAEEVENDDSPVLALPVDDEATAEVREGVLTIHGKNRLFLQVVPLDTVMDDYGHMIEEVMDTEEL
jgi:hypothetical protein